MSFRRYFPLGWTSPSQVIRFQVSRVNIEIKRRTLLSFYLCLLAFGLLHDFDVEININDVLGEHNSITFIVEIYKES